MDTDIAKLLKKVLMVESVHIGIGDYNLAKGALSNNQFLYNTFAKDRFKNKKKELSEIFLNSQTLLSNINNVQTVESFIKNIEILKVLLYKTQEYFETKNFQNKILFEYIKAFKNNIDPNKLDFKNLDDLREKPNYENEINLVNKDLDILNKTIDALKDLNIYNLKELLDNNIFKLSDFYAYYKYLNINKLNDVYKEIDEILSDNYKNIKPSYFNSLSLADDYIEYANANSDIAIKMKNNYLEKNIQYRTDEKGLNYKEIIIFNDNSIFAIDNYDNIFIPFNYNEAFKIISNIFNHDLSKDLPNNPSIRKAIIEKLKEDKTYREFEKAKSLTETFLGNYNILKNIKYDLLSELRDKHKDFEEIEDNLHVELTNYKIKQYANSISSNKYKFLYNEESYEIFRFLYNEKVPESLLQSNIGKKMASFNSVEEFNIVLNQFLLSSIGFTKESILEKAVKYSTELISSSDEMIILKIDNFEQSKNLGSVSWCISREEVYFDSYNKNNNQYFIFNINKSIKDNESMIGITLNKDFDYITSHLKDDKLAGLDNVVDYIEKIKIIENKQKRQNNLSI